MTNASHSTAAHDRPSSSPSTSASGLLAITRRTVMPLRSSAEPDRIGLDRSRPIGSVVVVGAVVVVVGAGAVVVVAAGGAGDVVTGAGAGSVVGGTVGGTPVVLTGAVDTGGAEPSGSRYHRPWATLMRTSPAQLMLSERTPGTEAAGGRMRSREAPAYSTVACWLPTKT